LTTLRALDVPDRIVACKIVSGWTLRNISATG
jgi:hypothetical protein